jgi:hypothetical protein
MMKLVIKRSKESAVFSDEANEDLYYGVDTPDVGRGFITRSVHQGWSENKVKPFFFVSFLQHITVGNTLDLRDFSEYDLGMLIDRLIENEIGVFQFESYNELLDWILEDEVK